MKPANSVACRWLLAARLLRWANVLLALSALAVLSTAILQLTASRRAGTSATSLGDKSPARPATRPALVEQIAARSIRQQLVPKAEPVADRVEIAPPTPASGPPPAPTVEIVATYVGEDAPARAFVRRAGAPDLLVWSAGSVEGTYKVTDIGDGWVALESGQTRHTLRVPRRVP